MKCPYCGVEVAPNTAVCPVCRRELPLQKNASTPTDTQNFSEQPTMGMGDAMARGFLKYAVFRGRARRSEYWLFFLFLIILTFILSLALTVFLNINVTGGRFVDVVQLVKNGDVSMVTYLVVMAIFFLLVLTPSVALTVRRLHDTGRSGWWIFLSLLPIANIVLIVFLFLDSQPGRNEYGGSNKYVLKED